MCLSPRLLACPILNYVLTSWYLCLLSHGHKEFRAFLARKQFQAETFLFSCRLYLEFQMHPGEMKRNVFNRNVCRMWASLQKYASRHQMKTVEWGTQPSHQQSAGIKASGVSAQFSPAVPLWPGTRGQWSKNKSIPSNQTEFPEFSMCASFSH